MLHFLWVSLHLFWLDTQIFLCRFKRYRAGGNVSAEFALLTLSCLWRWYYGKWDVGCTLTPGLTPSDTLSLTVPRR